MVLKKTNKQKPHNNTKPELKRKLNLESKVYAGFSDKQCFGSEAGFSTAISQDLRLKSS